MTSGKFRLSLLWVINLHALISILLLHNPSQAQQSLQYYTPSILLLPGQWEFKNVHNYYTQTRQFDTNGSKVPTGRGRESYYTMVNQFAYGISDRLNLGLDLWIKSVNLEINPSANWTAITGLGPKVKFLLSRKPGLSLQSTLLFPLAKNLEGNTDRAFLEYDRILWLNQFFFDKIIAPDFQVLTQFSIQYAIVRNSSLSNNNFQTPMRISFNYLPTNRWTVHALSELWPVHYNTNEQRTELFHAYFIQSGLGIRYQLIINRVEVELLYTNFIYGSVAQGAGESFNTGIRVIK